MFEILRNIHSIIIFDVYGEYRQLTGRTHSPATLGAIRMLGFEPRFCHALCIWIFDF